MVSKVKVDTIIRDIINLLSSSSSSRTSPIKINLLLLRLGINLVLPPDQVSLLRQDNLTSISPVHLLDPVNPTPDNTIKDIINLLLLSSSSRTNTIKINLLRLRLGISLVLPWDQVNLLRQDNLTSISPVLLLDPANPTPVNTIKAATKTILRAPIKDTINRVAKVTIRDTVRDTVRDSGVVATALIPLDKLADSCPQL